MSDYTYLFICINSPQVSPLLHRFISRCISKPKKGGSTNTEKEENPDSKKQHIDTEITFNDGAVDADATHTGSQDEANCKIFFRIKPTATKMVEMFPLMKVF